jgi:hypothetical protein
MANYTEHLPKVPPACSFASGFQALSVALMLPGIASLRGIGWQNLPGYLVEGAPQCAWC